MKTNLVIMDQGKRPTTNDPKQLAMWQLPTTPTVLGNIRGGAVQYAVWWMRLLGITKITVKQTLIGMKSISDISFKAMIEQPPEELKVCRNTIVRTLAESLTIVGVLEIEIVPDEKELKDLVAFWQQIQKPPAVRPTTDVRLNTETDPTGDKVIDNGSIKAESASNTAVAAGAGADESGTKPADNGSVQTADENRSAELKAPATVSGDIRSDSQPNAVGGS